MITWTPLAEVGAVNLPVNGSAGGIDWIEVTDRVHFENVRRVHRNLAYRDQMAMALAILGATEINNAHAGDLLIAASDSGHEIPEDTLEELLLVSINADGTLKSAGGAGIEPVPIQNKDAGAITTDIALHVTGKTGAYWEVHPCDPANAARATCAGFATSSLGADATGLMQIGPWMTGVGAATFPFCQLIVGTDSKPAWVDPGTGVPTGNYLTMGSGSWLFVLGEGRGVGVIQRFSAIAHQV